MTEVVHWNAYIKLLMRGLHKLPPVLTTNLHRGVKADISELQLRQGGTFKLHGFTSTTSAIQILQPFIGESGCRVLLQFHLTHNSVARDISDFSLYSAEREVLLPPNIVFSVEGILPAGAGLFIVQCKQISNHDPYSSIEVENIGHWCGDSQASEELSSPRSYLPEPPSQTRHQREARGGGRGEGDGEARGGGRGEGDGETRGGGRGEGDGEARGGGRGEGDGEARGGGRGDGDGEARGGGRGEGDGEARGGGRGEGDGEARGGGRGEGDGEARGGGRGEGDGEARGGGRGEGDGEARGGGRGEGDGDGRGDSIVLNVSFYWCVVTLFGNDCMFTASARQLGPIRDPAMLRRDIEKARQISVVAWGRASIMVVGVYSDVISLS
jgi:hypothetical protein